MRLQTNRLREVLCAMVDYSKIPYKIDILSMKNLIRGFSSLYDLFLNNDCSVIVQRRGRVEGSMALLITPIQDKQGLFFALK